MMKPKLLVTNRSEIACRIFQVCREMGLGAIGLLVPGDEQSRHVTYADELLSVPSYLDAQAIVQAAKAAQVQWIHPGYGFLSENASFAHLVEASGLGWIGPRPETMQQLGCKIAAKQLAEQLKIPILPWSLIPDQASLPEVAQKVGFPLFLKASGGGGGKGMRWVEDWSTLQSAYQQACSECSVAFADSRVFAEKAILYPRHIEVQVFGDGDGEGVHLWDRECSLQRRHQKIWEEAPSIHLSQTLRTQLIQEAFKLVRATRYRSAGTVEFMVDESTGQYYFLEMNTRLQVEHPVTEKITGIDLVWLQIAQAQSPELWHALKQAWPVQTQGHAIEVRIYAEDPMQDGMPTSGVIERLRWPTGAGIRIESGIEQGQSIDTQFDGLLAKLIVNGQTRFQALARLQVALQETVLLGLTTNLNFLKALSQNSRILEGKIHTQFLKKDFLMQSSEIKPEPNLWEAIQLAHCFSQNNSHLDSKTQSQSPWESLGSKTWSLW